MESKTMALFLTFLLGLFIVIGAILSLFLKKRKKVLDFLMASCFSILLMLIILDLLPEAIEHLGLSYLWLFLLLVFVGFFFFKWFDHLIPHHHSKHDTKKEVYDNMIHIGTLATVALALHNIIEGMAIYFTSSLDLSLGIAMSLGVGLHNLPLGIIVGSTFYQQEGKFTSFLISLIVLAFSSFLGGLIPFVFNLKAINDLMMGSFLSLTLGMLIYLAFFEILPKVKKAKDKKIVFYGLITGVVIILCTLFF